MFSTWIDALTAALVASTTRTRWFVLVAIVFAFAVLLVSLIVFSLRASHYRKMADDLRGQLIAYAAKEASKRAEEHTVLLKQYLQGVQATDALSAKKKIEIKKAIEGRILLLKEKQGALDKEIKKTEKKDIHALLRQAQELETELRK